MKNCTKNALKFLNFLKTLTMGIVNEGTRNFLATMEYKRSAEEEPDFR